MRASCDFKKRAKAHTLSSSKFREQRKAFITSIYLVWVTEGLRRLTLAPQNLGDQRREQKYWLDNIKSESSIYVSGMVACPSDIVSGRQFTNQNAHAKGQEDSKANCNSVNSSKKIKNRGFFAGWVLRVKRNKNNCSFFWKNWWLDILL